MSIYNELLELQIWKEGDYIGAIFQGGGNHTRGIFQGERGIFRGQVSGKQFPWGQFSRGPFSGHENF